MAATFTQVVDEVYELELPEQQELRDILDELISDARKKEILQAYQETLLEEKEGKLVAHDSVQGLMNYLEKD